LRLLVAGPIAFDTVETPHGRRENLVGGAATYFALAARFFSQVAIVAAVGTDFPKFELDRLGTVGIDLEGVQVMPGKTFRWSGIYQQNMNLRDTIDLQVNVFGSFQPEVPRRYRDSEACFLTNMDPALQLQVLDQLRTPKLVGLDTMEHWIRDRHPQLLEVLRRVHFVIINEQEALSLSGEDSLTKAADRIFKLGPRHLFIKRGEEGALHFEFEREGAVEIRAYPVKKPLDPTGAGDAFAGAAAGHLAARDSLSPEDIQGAMEYGNVLGSFTVEQFGVAGLRSIDRGDIERRRKELPTLTKSGKN
jgi:sugar/nucleoside kinase (ribokinase family)